MAKQREMERTAMQEVPYCSALCVTMHEYSLFEIASRIPVYLFVFMDFKLSKIVFSWKKSAKD